ncbi:hypothetical protein DAETH_25540 [Deinococcus aetherius]|uniref:DUF927 domain-containing protein n=1 Tax=Deinococcus aetherius TaxID=200252 RepID=A0ABN6RII1_9DEIO|nr:DUF927 domain-containing protein [Deinococcus aetherius]BDP42585.1 hypothetical protein DAETH_25540 [Deinococcus aetherius]
MNSTNPMPDQPTLFAFADTEAAPAVLAQAEPVSAGNEVTARPAEEPGQPLPADLPEPAPDPAREAPGGAEAEPPEDSPAPELTHDVPAEPQEPAPYVIHPETHKPMYLPKDWYDEEGKLSTLGKRDEMVTAYPGMLYVRAIGRNVANDHRFLEVTFEAHGKLHTVQASRQTFASPGSLTKFLSKKGAYVNSGTASGLVKYLSLFEAENARTLPTRLVSDQFGLHGEHLVTPTGSLNDAVLYIGEGHRGFSVGPDEHAYEDSLREIATWEGAFPLWWAIALTLASPIFKRLNPRRYPVTYFAGDSGTGKTTALFFAQGVWVTPGLMPFTLQGTRTTQVGFERTLEQLGGLPLLIDEAHMCKRPEALESTVYAFANGQSYVRARSGEGVHGGVALGGAVLLAGEARPEFQNAGSHNRLLLVNADVHPPLGTGAGRGTALGQERARWLEEVWSRGAGHLGLKLAGIVLGDWARYRGRVEELRRTPPMVELRDWGHAVAAVQTTLEVLFREVLHVPMPEDVQRLPALLLKLLTTHRTESNPALEAFEAIRTLILQTNRKFKGNVLTLASQGQMIGWRSETAWHLVTTSSAFTRQVGAQAVQLHGKRWAEQGWVQPTSNGPSTRSVYCPVTGGTMRVLVIPREVIEGESRQV